MARGTLRIYLGAAPGVGKTYRMLDEGRRRAERGADVVIGVVETHGRKHTEAQLGDLEVVPRRSLTHRDASFEEMDLQAILDRAPQVVLVDEFAHTNVPGSGNEKRWQDVDVLLEHGIDVISTLNIQHLESLADVVAEITGVVQRETVPDEVVRRAEQVELVDMAAQALRRRLAHGNVYAPDKIDAALAQYFREGNLLSLRELALLWTAGRVDDALRRYRDTHRIEQPWETRERIVVALDGTAAAPDLLRRGARIAERSRGELLAVHVTRADGLSGRGSPAYLAECERLVEQLGGAYQVVVGADVGSALVEYARSVDATQLVLGPGQPGRIGALLGAESVAERVVRQAGAIDVHLVARADQQRGRRALPSMRRGLGVRRIGFGLTAGVVLVALLTAGLDAAAGALALQTVFLAFLLPVVVAAWLGGVLVAVLVAVLAAVALNWFFTPPVGTLDVTSPENFAALLIFVVIGVALGAAAELSARRAEQSSRAAAEAALLAQLATGALRGRNTPAGLLTQILETFRLQRVELEVRDRPGGAWKQRSVVGEGTRADSAALHESVIELDGERRIRAIGRALDASGLRVLHAFGAQLGAVVDREVLAGAAAAAREVKETGRARDALLASVGHDLRTPLAGIKAAVSSLRQDDVDFSPEDQSELLATIEHSTDRLTRIVGDLLDMTRLQGGGVASQRRPVLLDEVLGAVLADAAAPVETEGAEQLPAVDADPALLERVLSNVVSNAIAHGGSPVRIRADRLGATVQLRVIDRGPGVPPAEHERIFEPFARGGAAPPDTPGLGLGLAVARGLAQSFGATVEAEDTPGGGLTVVIALAVAEPRDEAAA